MTLSSESSCFKAFTIVCLESSDDRGRLTCFTAISSPVSPLSPKYTVPKEPWPILVPLCQTDGPSLFSSEKLSCSDESNDSSSSSSSKSLITVESLFSRIETATDMRARCFESKLPFFSRDTFRVEARMVPSPSKCGGWSARIVSIAAEWFRITSPTVCLTGTATP
ncbi:hypothetical protein OGATHE_004639 [Ogataea polymorpha]|uniref:Uncharacterized protein n=1 Tax=Ogataea polymorpha TaxID=460523 RepID=A0A9P8T1Q7_9ASCO|nr:hypothetical protein OGATHE_004639 [Ogataea polymorpha]